MRIEYIEHRDVAEDGWKVFSGGAGHVHPRPGLRLMTGPAGIFLQVGMERDNNGTVRIVNVRFDDEADAESFFYKSESIPNQPTTFSIE